MFDTSSDESGCGCGRVASRVARNYILYGHDATITSVPWADESGNACDGRFVVVPDLHRIDFVLDAEGDISRTVDPLSGPVEAGWEVWAVVPLARIAEAHDVFRDRLHFVQGWWDRTDGEITFAGPEIP